MRGLLLALVLLAVPLTGCFDDEPAYTLEGPDPPNTGLLLTYEIDQGDGTEIHQLMAYSRLTGPGYDLLTYNATRLLDSPFTELSAQGSPREAEWGGFVTFPLVDGESYQPSGVAGVRDATVTVEAMGNATAPFDDRRAFRLTATGPDGATLATVELLETPTIPARIEIQVDGEQETWRLIDLEENRGWNQPPLWKLGRWWTYDAVTRVETGVLAAENMTLVFNERAPGSQGIQHAFLNAVEFDHRQAALPFHQIRTSDLASQAGLLNPIISKMWDWPLEHQAAWSGTTLIGSEDKRYTAAPTLVRGYTLPDGVRTVAFEIDARLVEDGRTLGTWTYAPLVGFLTEITFRQEPDQAPRLDWELKGWGTGYHGPMEIPRTDTLLGRTSYQGPTNVTENLTVGDKVEIVEIRGFVGRSQGASPNSSLVLQDPNGTVRYALDAGDFGSDTGFSFAEVVQASPGTWTLGLDLEEGTTLLVTSVRGIWPEVVQQDFRSS